jgi:hypothetical protein
MLLKVVGNDMRMIPKVTRDWPRTDGPQPSLGDLISWIVTCSFRIPVLLLFLLDDL